MIICAAVKVIMNNIAGTSAVVCGHRHADCIETISHFNDCWKFAKRIEGFIDHNNNFLDREEAFKHALTCGQISQHDAWYRIDNRYTAELYSEDLY